MTKTYTVWTNEDPDVTLIRTIDDLREFSDDDDFIADVETLEVGHKIVSRGSFTFEVTRIA
jgi:hypothetical protein